MWAMTNDLLVVNAKTGTSPDAKGDKPLLQNNLQEANASKQTHGIAGTECCQAALWELDGQPQRQKC
jgi:hypothetical protein